MESLRAAFAPLAPYALYVAIAYATMSSVTTTRLLGIVLNDVRFSLADRHRHYESYYRRYYDPQGKS